MLNISDPCNSSRMSAAAAVAKIAKPNMRGMHVNQIKKNLIGATVVSILVT